MAKTTQIKQLTEAVSRLESPGEVVEFLRGILTPKELTEIAQRLEIVKMLKKGVPQRKISEDLGVGIATVTRGSKELKKGRFKNV